MATLLAGGCSFTLGNELSDHHSEMDVSQLTWSALLAKEMGMDYICTAIPGASNQTIARLMTNALSKQQVDFAAVMWTFTSRYEYHDRNANNYKQVSVELAKRDSSVGVYYDICGDDEVQELHTSLTSFLLLQELLVNRNVPYVFTTADLNPLDRYAVQHPNDSIASLISLIDWSRWHWIGEEREGFFEWAKSRYPCGPLGHPLDPAHAKLARDIRVLT